MKTQKINKAAAQKELAEMKGRITQLEKIINESGDIKYRIENDIPTTYEDICEIDGVDPIECLPWKNPINEDQRGDNYFSKIQRIIRVINDGCVFDYGNGNQKKWRIWWDWDVRKSAFVFSHTDYDWTCTISGGGSRLSFETEKKAIFFANNFIKEANDLLTIKNQ